jgi:hypothetical protein
MPNTTETQASEPLQVYVDRINNTFTTSSAPIKHVFGYGKKPEFEVKEHRDHEGLLAHLGELPQGSAISWTNDAFYGLPEAHQRALEKDAVVYG